jgi:hypothetical protein
LEPFAVIAALRRLLEDPHVPDREVTGIVGGPYSVTGCIVTGNIAALAKCPPPLSLVMAASLRMRT